jgi:hypothetical protein
MCSALRRWRRPETALFAALALFSAPARAELLDRIAVTVGKQVIAESEVIRDLRVSSFLDRKPVDLSGENKRKSAERLVDQVLILREAAESRIPLATDETAVQLLEQVKAQYASEAEYQAALSQYRVTEDEVRAQLLSGLRALQFTDARFRPEVEVSEDELRDFYVLLSAGERRPGADPPSFEESRAQVQKLLVDQRVIQALDTWLSLTRTQIGVEYRGAVFQ